MSEVCRAFGISRKTGYKIFNRCQDEGLDALADRSRRPVRYANQLPDPVERLIVDLKRDKPHWGARKIRELLIRKLAGDMRLPAKSTVHAVLDRHGLVKRARVRKNRAAGTPLSAAALPNDLWCADFKGEFKLGNGRYCYPPHGHRPGLALPALVRSLRLHPGGPGHRSLPAAVPRARPARRHQER
jgi:transposase InsO family protein